MGWWSAWINYALSTRFGGDRVCEFSELCHLLVATVGRTRKQNLHCHFTISPRMLAFRPHFIVFIIGTKYIATVIDFNTVKSITESWIEPESGFDTAARAFQSLMVSLILGLDEDEARDAVVDGSNDRGVDAVYIDERMGRNIVHIFQFKYKIDYKDASKNFPGAEVDKISSFVDDLLNKNESMKKSCNPLLWDKVEQSWEAFDRKSPSVEIHFCGNMKQISNLDQNRIKDSFKKYNWFKINHHDLERIVMYFVESKREKIDRSFKIVDRDYFERTDGNVRALIATVEASEIVRIITDCNNDQEVNELIFDDNVRIYLTRSNPINKEIIATALSDSRRLFWYLNNGLTITCDSFSYPSGSRAPTVDVKGLQIVNGGQTSHALFEASKIDIAAVSDVLVVVRVIEAKVADIGARISETTNSQTPINSRDLKANTLVQRKIEEALFGLDYYYERKANQHADKPKNKRLDALTAGQAYLAYELELPEVAKKDRGRIFGDLFTTVYSEDLNPSNLLTPVKIFKDIEKTKKQVQKKIRDKQEVNQDDIFIIDGAHHILFAVKRLCVKDGIDHFDYEKSKKKVDEAILIVKQCVSSRRERDKGFTFNRYFKDAGTRTEIALAIKT